MNSTKNDVLLRIEQHVKQALSDAEAGHDWLHIDRVRKTAREIVESEPLADWYIVELAVLLHDIADAKFYNGDETIGISRAKQILENYNVEVPNINTVLKIIENVSYRNELSPSGFHSLELNIVKDADRLDAIGAIGIARAFTYGGFKNRRLYDAEVLPVNFTSKADYAANKGTTINHFFEKLLGIKSLLLTTKGKEIGEERHQVLLEFLKHFTNECDLIHHQSLVK